MPVQRRRKDPFTKTPTLGIFQLRKTGAHERGLVDFHDECAQVRGMSVVMCIEETELRLDECLGQRLKTLGSSEPGKAVCHQTNRGSKFTRMRAAY